MCGEREEACEGTGGARAQKKEDFHCFAERKKWSHSGVKNKDLKIKYTSTIVFPKTVFVLSGRYIYFC